MKQHDKGGILTEIVVRPLPDWMLESARRFVASQARDVEDARLLLGALGLVEET